MEEKIKELEMQRQVLLSTASDLAKEITSLKKELWTSKTGFKIGDNISFMDGKELKSGRLVDIDVKYTYSVYPKVKLFKKDGSLGLREQNIYNHTTMKHLNSK